MKNKKLFAILTLVCFMMTLMPVAAFAAPATVGAPDAETSSFVAVDGDQTVRLNKVNGENDDKATTFDPDKEGVDFTLDLLDRDENNTTGSVCIWAVNENGTVTSALNVIDGDAKEAGINNVFTYKVTDKETKTVKLQFNRSGKYKVYAGLKDEGDDSVSDLNKFNCVFSTITVKTSAADPENYTAVATFDKTTTDVTKADNVFTVTEGKTTSDAVLHVIPNNVMEDKVTVKFEYKDKALKNKNVKIETNSSSIEVSKETATTNSQGKIDVDVSASVEGSYEIDFVIDGVAWTLKVQVGNTSAAYIDTVKEPSAPLALFDAMENDTVEFTITDINGNTVTDRNGLGKTVANDNGKYIVLTTKPSDSDLVSEDLTLAYNATDRAWYLDGVGNMDAEGKYEVKVILENGDYATAAWEVKRFQKPVELKIQYATKTVELGGNITGKMVYVDENGVQKVAKDAEFAATGYAVASATKLSGDSAGKGRVVVKSDEKYVGAKITVTAVSEKYDLVGTAELTVAEGASDIAFASKTAEVNVNNKLTWNVVDVNGNKVALGSDIKTTEIKYVVLDKPEGAKVSTNDVTIQKDLISKGEGKLALTSNKVGNVAVQVVLKAVYDPTSDSSNNETLQVKYYTGTQIFAVGTGSAGDVVVMSIGSHEIVINDKTSTIDAAPMIQNDRTYVPFRALAEAFKAEVAYDEATQAVTAKLNGVTVVMTIGSATYTVNGVEKTMDVAPFINGSRTMVPVRFAAEAFGIKVIPTYNPDGSTADILFNL